MIDEMIGRCESKDAIALGVELAEKAIDEGKKNVEYFTSLAEKYSEDEILAPYGKRLGDVIKNCKSYVSFHENLKLGLEKKQATIQ